MKKILYALLIALTTLSLISCSEVPNTGNSTTGQQQETPASAYDKLSNLEKQFFDAFIETVNSFYNPSEVKIMQIGDISVMDDGNISAFIKIQGTNKLGGTITDWYHLYHDGSVYRLAEAISWSTTDDTVSVAKINKALNEYWEELGLS